MKQHEIIEKIRKLLALAQSASLHESEAALGMANSLLLKHNLSMRDVHGNVFSFDENGKRGYFEMAINSKNGLNPLVFWITHLIQNYFFVSAIVSKPQYLPADAIERNIVFVGEFHNVEVALYVYEFLERKFEDLWLQYKTESGCSDKNYDAYISGLSAGLEAKLKAQRQSENTNRKALVAINKDLEAFVTSFITPGFKSVKGISNDDLKSYDNGVVRKGTEAGAKINILSALNPNTDRKKVA
jgi:hypothetical protein